MINSFFRRLFMMNKFLISIVSSFLFPEFQALIITKIHLHHCKASPRVLFNFPFVWSFFYYQSSHDGSTWWFVKDSSHSSIVLQDFSWSYDPPSYTLKLNMVLNTCFLLRRSSILLLAFRSAILSTLSFEVVLCHSR